ATVIVRGLDIGDTAAAFPDREISAAAMRNHPLLAEPDAFEALGGGEVSLKPESPSGVNIRGGASDQTAYLLDGIPVFNPYHAAGLSSGWNPDALSRLHVTSSTQQQAYPNTLSGAIEAITRTPGDRTHGQGSVSTTQSRITFDGPLGSWGAGGGTGGEAGTGGRAGYLVSMRTGLPGAIAPKDEVSYLKGETGDWLAKLEAPAFGGRIKLLGYGNENDLNTAVVVAPDDGTTPDPRRNVFEWISRSLGAQWMRTFSGTAVRVVGWRADGNAGSVWASHAGPVDMAAARRDKGLLVAVQRNSGSAVTAAEVRVEQSRTSYRIVSDSTSGPSLSLAANTPVATVLARHGRPIGRRFDVTLGAALAATGGKQHLGPSAQVVWNASNQLELSASYSRAHQFAQSLRNAESVVGNVFPVDIYMGAGLSGVAGAPDVPVARSQLGVIGASYRPREGLKLGVQAYRRGSQGLLLVAPREGEPFATAADAFTVGSGTSRGVSADVALSAKRYGIVLSYGYQRMRVEYGDSSYVPEHGAAHLLEGGVIVFPSATTSVRLGVTAAMGRRATSIAGGFEWEAANLYDRGSEFGGSPYYGGEPLGATELPTYYRLDLGVRKQWRVRLGAYNATVALFGTATNLLGRKNILTYARDPSTGELAGVEMRPRAPLVVGLDWGF
ncbi:MAG TPA: hypothetical protein VGS98_10910, partial [Thermoanaerobaculia bacterium]|nr:hypothetical protein [Thermoanaerobaculia bacterium]